MSVENPAVPLSSIAEGDELYDALTGGGETGAGVRVNRKKSLGLSAVWRGVNLIAGDVGRYPLAVYRYQGEAKIFDPAHQAARVLRRPNDYMTPFTFRQTLQAHALLSGNGYAVILRDAAAKPLELLPLDPDRTWPVRVNGVLWYVTQTEEPIAGKRRNGRALVKLPAADVLHVKGLGFDGLVGYPVLKILRETIGGALAARDYGTRYFLNDASPGIVLEVPANMKPDAITNLRNSWSEIHQGWKKSHRPAILRDGVKLVPFGKASARDAQMLESRAFDSREVANILGVPAHKVGDPSRTAYNSLESENQGYREDTLGNWFACWEQECDAKLLTEEEKDGETHAHKFDPRPFAGVPLTSLASFCSTLFNMGALSPDEARGVFNMNPRTDGRGAVYMVPVNLAPATAPAPVAGDPSQPAPVAESVNPNPEPTKETNA